LNILAVMMNELILDNLLSDIGGFVLVVFGFTITLFTVLYSFILSKRELLSEYSDQIKSKGSDPMLLQKNNNAKSIIIRLKNLNRHLIIIIFTTLSTYLLCMVTKYFVSNNCAKSIIIYISGIIVALIIIYVCIMLLVTIKDYYKNTRI
jgi:hypothetical protein